MHWRSTHCAVLTVSQILYHQYDIILWIFRCMSIASCPEAALRTRSPPVLIFCCHLNTSYFYRVLLYVRGPSCPEIPEISSVLKLYWNLKLSWNFSHLVRMSWYCPLLHNNVLQFTVLFASLLSLYLFTRYLNSDIIIVLLTCMFHV